jgi:hypothetical protein
MPQYSARSRPINYGTTHYATFPSLLLYPVTPRINGTLHVVPRYTDAFFSSSAAGIMKCRMNGNILMNGEQMGDWCGLLVSTIPPLD